MSQILFSIGNSKGSKASAPVKHETQKAPPPIEVPALSLDELKEKTDNFGSKALIGEGSYGRVYYATLNDGNAVAVKKLDVSSEPETNNEFLTQACRCYQLNKLFEIIHWKYVGFCMVIVWILAFSLNFPTSGFHGLKIEE